MYIMVRDKGDNMNKIYKNLSNARSGKSAFTLAEVLITLGIIGVVAALTLPNLIHKYQDRVLTSRFKKGYSELSRAWSMVVAEDPYKYLNTKGGWECEWPDGTTSNPTVWDNRIEDLRSKMKVQKICGNVYNKNLYGGTDCWPASYEKYQYGNDIPSRMGGNSLLTEWVTVDGMCFSGGLGQWDTTHISMDTNCDEGPNRLGDDIFSMLLGADGIVYFATDSKSAEDAPVRSGLVCPFGEFTVNGRTINFRDRLQK